MAIEFNTASSTNGDASSFTFGHDATGSDIILVGVASKQSTFPLVSSVTFNGTDSFTYATGCIFGSTQLGEVWYLESPTSTSGNIVVNTLVSERVVCGAASYLNVSGIRTDNIVCSSGQNTNATGTMTTIIENSVVFSSLSVRDRTTTITSDADLTQRYTNSNTGNPANRTATGRGYDEGVGVGLSAGSYAYGHDLSAVEAWTMINLELVLKPITGDIVSYGFIM